MTYATENTAMGEQLHVFTNGYETVVARDAYDARAVMVEEWGGTPDDFSPVAEWSQLPDDKPLTIGFEQGDEPTPGEAQHNGFVNVTKTCAEWAASEGRRLIGSTEY